MPDLNLKVLGCAELWLELKAGTPHLDLRPAQYAWAARRVALGGRVLALNRHKLPGAQVAAWFLYDLRHTTFEPKGLHLRALTPALHTGWSFEHLAKCIESIP